MIRHAGDLRQRTIIEALQPAIAGRRFHCLANYDVAARAFPYILNVAQSLAEAGVWSTIINAMIGQAYVWLPPDGLNFVIPSP